MLCIDSPVGLASHAQALAESRRTCGPNGIGTKVVSLMATLYRCSTPTNFGCRCGTVARALRREEIHAREVRVPQRRARRDEVEALSGQRRVPLLVIDGETICDSRRILEHLEWRREQAAATHPPATDG